LTVSIIVIILNKKIRTLLIDGYTASVIWDLSYNMSLLISNAELSRGGRRVTGELGEYAHGVYKERSYFIDFHRA